jgi:hypothetical protein
VLPVGHCRLSPHQRPGKRFGYSRTTAQLVSAEMSSHAAGHIVKTRLPQHGVIEETLDKDHLPVAADLIPAIPAALTARQKPVRWR